MVAHLRSLPTTSRCSIFSSRRTPFLQWFLPECNDGHSSSAGTTTLLYSYKPGEQHANADSLSCLPLPESPESVTLPPETIHQMQQLDASPVTSNQIKWMTGQDPLLSKVRDLVFRRGSYATLEAVKPYHKYWNELSVHTGCLLRGSHIVIPPPARAKVIELLHEGHPGNVRMKSLARSYVCWRGIDLDLENKAKACDPCQKTHKSPITAPLYSWEFPKQLWRRLHADFAGPFLGKMFLLVVDSYSKWLEVVPLSAATTTLTINSQSHWSRECPSFCFSTV